MYTRKLLAGILAMLLLFQMTALTKAATDIYTLNPEYYWGARLIATGAAVTVTSPQSIAFTPDLFKDVPAGYKVDPNWRLKLEDLASGQFTTTAAVRIYIPGTGGGKDDYGNDDPLNPTPTPGTTPTPTPTATPTTKPTDLPYVRVMPFMQGYPDGTMHPDGNLTRAELAQIIYNLEASGATNINLPYTDIKSDHWSARAVSYVTNEGYMNGYPDKSFKPDRQITRAEVTATIARLKSLTTGTSSILNDIYGHWAFDYITAMSSNNIINGYPDGSFKPDRNISRGETASIVCKAFNRNYTQYDSIKFFSDLHSNHWAYDFLMHAANGYNYFN